MSAREMQGECWVLYASAGNEDELLGAQLPSSVSLSFLCGLRDGWTTASGQKNREATDLGFSNKTTLQYSNQSRIAQITVLLLFPSKYEGIIRDLSPFKMALQRSAHIGQAIGATQIYTKTFRNFSWPFSLKPSNYTLLFY